MNCLSVLCPNKCTTTLALPLTAPAASQNNSHCGIFRCNKQLVTAACSIQLQFAINLKDRVAMAIMTRPQNLQSDFLGGAGTQIPQLETGKKKLSIKICGVKFVPLKSS